MKLTGNSYLVQGDADSIGQVHALLEKNGARTAGNPDLYTRVYQHFGIDEAREIRDRAQSKAIVGEQRIFIVVAPGMTQEAQNALLKTIEEPPGGALFFFIVPSPLSLLPTVRSRAQILTLRANAKESSLVDEKKFLASSPSARLDMLKPLFEKGDDDKRDMAEILTFLSSLERRLSDMKTDRAEGLDALYNARKYVTDKGALVKPLLESVALLVPVL